MKMEDVVPQARRVHHLDQVASSVVTVGLDTSGTHMAYLVGFVFKTALKIGMKWMSFCT